MSYFKLIDRYSLTINNKQSPSTSNTLF